MTWSPISVLFFSAEPFLLLLQSRLIIWILFQIFFVLIIHTVGHETKRFSTMWQLSIRWKIQTDMWMYLDYLRIPRFIIKHCKSAVCGNILRTEVKRAVKSCSVYRFYSKLWDSTDKHHSYLYTFKFSLVYGIENVVVHRNFVDKWTLNRSSRNVE